MKILIGTDGSETGERALAYGLDLARRLGAAVTAVHVVQEPPLAAAAALLTGLSVDVAREEDRARGRAAVARARTLAQQAGVPAQVELLEGHAAETLMREAAGHDLLVVGTHGHRGMDRLLLGSVAGALVTRAPVPVLVVR